MEKTGSKRLSELALGERGYVIGLLTEGSMRRRFLDIGLVEGTEVACLGQSPSGDPRAYRIRGAVIAIRSEDAKTVVTAAGGVCSLDAAGRNERRSYGSDKRIGGARGARRTKREGEGGDGGTHGRSRGKSECREEHGL